MVGGDSEVDCEESVLSTDVAVNAFLPLAIDEKSPRAVQFPGAEHDTELNMALPVVDLMPSENSVGSALPQTPFVDV